ncbi:MAG: damage-inducible protein DinB [Acidobacteria bacterium]|nr:damage-inducible protein DinB [Acidobacteriota bacterium]
MPDQQMIVNEYIRELEGEARATRDCLANVPMDKPEYVPHEKSMQLGYLAILVADIPRWIQYMIEQGTIDFQTYQQKQAKSSEDLVALFDENLANAKAALSSITDSELSNIFTLKNGDQVYLTQPLSESISEAINHMVHHRGQLTVYLRLNDIAVPSIYGPSADTQSF